MVDAIVGAIDQLSKRVFVGLLRSITLLNSRSLPSEASRMDWRHSIKVETIRSRPAKAA
jgi:hypothetical protein